MNEIATKTSCDLTKNSNMVERIAIIAICGNVLGESMFLINWNMPICWNLASTFSDKFFPQYGQRWHYVNTSTLIETDMAKKLTKALRGKRRWIGCFCDGFDSRKDVKNYLCDLPVKLYDFEGDKCILLVKLEDYENGTNLIYEVEANVGGKIAQVGSRLIDMTAKKMADIFFGKFW